MKEELLLTLSTLLEGEIPVKFRVNEIATIREQLIPLLTDEEVTHVTNVIRAKVQKEAEQHWRDNGCKGAVLMATGTGKSKIGVSITVEDAQHIDMFENLVVVPTEKLRDEGWHEEFVKWGAHEEWNNVQRSCYASLHKITGKRFKTVILDEGHNLTPLNSTFFANNTVEKIIWLSATKPRDKEKIGLLKELGIHPVYEITLDEAVKLGLTPPYEITVITTKLDTKDKYIKSGNKEKTFYQTEAAKYGYLTNRCLSVPTKQHFLDRMRFVYGLKSKSMAAKWLLDNVIPKQVMRPNQIIRSMRIEDYRTLIFAGSKKEAVLLCENRFFSKPSKPKPLKEGATEFQKEKYNTKLVEYQIMMSHYQGDESFKAFKEKIISRMSCIEAVNEGHNIPDLDCCFVVQLNSNELNLWQRMGRIRFRPGITSRIIILCCENTEDKNWVEKAAANLNEANIRWVSLDDLKSGKETIKFT